ncbi:MAG: hypothetical protein JWM07_22, partial [Candidatus Saccharibacteria bacterium]|nr:hypothetical protein [Candidatus Saccharibacteria bacterium]
MWDLRLLNPFDQLSIRNALLLIATMLVAVFAYIFATAPSAYAADATWQGSAITYDSHQYIQVSDGTGTNTTNLPNGIHYSYIDPQQKAHVISFPSGADLATVTAAQYSEYSFVPPGTYN